MHLDQQSLPSIMDSNANARMKESLMRYQPLDYQPEEPPHTSMLCSKCQHALHRAEDMFQSMVEEAVNDYTTVYHYPLISNMKHQIAMNIGKHSSQARMYGNILFEYSTMTRPTT